MACRLRVRDGASYQETDVTELPEIAMQADEKSMLVDFLNFQRTVLLRKSEGLRDEQGSQTAAPSSLTLKGLLKHMAFVESHWSNYVLLGHDPQSPWAEAPWDDDPDWDFTTANDEPLAELQARYRSAWGDADAIYRAAGIDDLAARPGADGVAASVRWILLHMIEEYARHIGHADFLREAIDGSVGD